MILRALANDLKIQHSVIPMRFLLRLLNNYIASANYACEVKKQQSELSLDLIVI
ncbi:hypothetical protein JCM18904_289 [Vibrio sp. JCM 18904]|nr:hypothetical protein JCM18904_289 [Vibrio sp. JCM 18904]